MASYSDCHGCALCLLSCPMWLQKRDVRFSPQGIAKALQHGAVAEDIAEEVSTCIDCGACDLLCPEQIDLSAMISSLRSECAPEPEPDIESDHVDTHRDVSLQMHLTADDLFIIDARPFHTHYAQRLAHYDVLRKATGCQMNLDLNRMAIATGIGSRADQCGMFDVTSQIQWLMQGRSFERVIVENPADQVMLAQLSGKPVICLSDLIRSEKKHA
ncbi:hypothetical protein D8Y20_05710 [Mariprofundus sp. EBB-1]|uniref:4Fe-4S dicluster domain-containing protein n=1 Tax=Mariprofundus sp. EBB-1 TaxID=2650971 RepID=UPI000EF1DC7D|nr:4Fe-4S dicluster domain-containing protein [Mariprofundus sp. EBB-1]RLL53001.1 hypothetical protein D8Y20_05710 [Mariprofundus sp. EBB-1]